MEKLLAPLMLLAACSGGSRILEPPADSDVPLDGDGDADGIGDGDIDIDPGDPALVPNCGDGVLDPEEECDDHNRLNGDGCDWVCRLGDGPSTPEPDPDTPRYVPSGPETASEGAAWRGLGIPLLWNGSNLVAATYEPTPYARPEEAETHIRFFEATVEGAIGGNDWNYPVDSADGTEGEGIRLDLVWSGEGYGLFYAAPVEGPWLSYTDLWFLNLDETGKPLGEPVMVASNRFNIVSIAADLSDQGFVVAWGEWNEGSTRCGRFNELTTSLFVQVVAPDGTSVGLPGPIPISDDVIGRPAIVRGEDGFGISLIEGSMEADPSCSARFVHLSQDLTEFTTSGALANTLESDVQFDGEEYVVALAHFTTSERYEPGELCVARYTTAGMLSSPPVCNGPFADHDLDYWFRPLSLAIGDHGLAVVLTTEFRIPAGMEETDPRLFFFRTDLAGRQVSSPVEIDRSSMISDASIVWTGDGFTSLHSRSDATSASSVDALVFNRFTLE